MRRAPRQQIEDDKGDYMTREQAKQNLIAIGVEEPSKEQIDSYLNQFGTETRRMQGQIEQLSEYQNTAAKLQAQIDEAEKSKLSDIEKLKLQLTETQALVDAANKQSAEYKAALTKANIASVFAQKGLTADFYQGIIGSLAGLSENDAIQIANTFVDGIIKENQATIDSKKAEWEAEKLKSTVNPDGGTGKQDPSPKSAAAEYAQSYSAKMNPELNNTSLGADAKAPVNF